MHDTRRSTDLRAGTDFDMIGYPYPAAKHATIADNDAPRQAAMASDDAVPSNPDVVGDLDQIVDLRPFADHCIVKRSSIDRRVGAYFDTVLNYHASELRDLLEAAGAWNEPEPVLAYLNTAMDNHAVSNQRVLNQDTGAYPAVATDLAVVRDDGIGADDTISSDCGVIPYDGPSLDHRAIFDICET